MNFDRIRHRLEAGRPLVLDADTGASFRARGVGLDVPGTLGLLLRERPRDVLSHYRAEVLSSVDVLSTLTADTTPRALAEVGMQHRSAMLTDRAVELAFEAMREVDRTVGVAGVLGSDMVSPVAADRLEEELTEHATRLKFSGVELIIARGQGSRRGLMAAVGAAVTTELPVWAVIECHPGGELDEAPLDELVAATSRAGASVVLFEVPSGEAGLSKLEAGRRALEAAGVFAGVLVAASEAAIRGFDDPTSEPKRWVERALELSHAGARVIGGGAGTTEAHTQALAQALGSLHPSVLTRRSDAELERGSGVC